MPITGDWNKAFHQAGEVPISSSSSGCFYNDFKGGYDFFTKMCGYLYQNETFVTPGGAPLKHILLSFAAANNSLHIFPKI